VSVPPGRRTRWKDRADDPELERELIEELDRRRRAREEDRERRAQERRSRWVIWLFVLLTAAAAVAIGYGALQVARALTHEPHPSKASFGACLRNFIPFLLYGIVMLVLFLVAVIPIGLGLLVMIPLSLTSTYAAYRGIFTEDSRPAAPVAA